MTYQPYHTIIGGVLGDAEQVTLHYGFNGWSDVADQPMNGQGEVKWQVKLNLPVGAHELDSCLLMGPAGITTTARTRQVCVSHGKPRVPRGHGANGAAAASVGQALGGLIGGEKKYFRIAMAS